MKNETLKLYKLCLEEANENYLKNKEEAHELIFNIERKLLFSDYEKEDIQQLLKLLFAIGQSKNRLSRYVEEDLQKRVTDLIFRENHKNYSEEYLSIQINKVNVEDPKIEKYLFISKILYEFALNILNLKIEKNKYCDNRRANALRILCDLIEYYKVRNILNVFEESLNEKRENELFFAINGIDKYFKINSERVLNKPLKVKIKGIHAKTKDSMIKNMCSNILW